MAPEEPDSVFDTLCPDGIARNVWYHFANATDAVNTSSVFNGSDALIGDNILISSAEQYSKARPSVTSLENDNFVVVWQADQHLR